VTANSSVAAAAAAAPPAAGLPLATASVAGGERAGVGGSALPPAFSAALPRAAG
jgi:hypothetical protein